MPCIQPSISDHFKVLFRNVADEPFDEIHGRDCFLHIFSIFMAVVMKSNHFAIIFINTGSGYDRTSEIASNIFDYVFRVTFVWFCINIETIFMFGVTFRFYFFICILLQDDGILCYRRYILLLWAIFLPSEKSLNERCEFVSSLMTQICERRG